MLSFLIQHHILPMVAMNWWLYLIGKEFQRMLRNLGLSLTSPILSRRHNQRRRQLTENLELSDLSHSCCTLDSPRLKGYNEREGFCRHSLAISADAFQCSHAYKQRSYVTEVKRYMLVPRIQNQFINICQEKYER